MNQPKPQDFKVGELVLTQSLSTSIVNAKGSLPVIYAKVIMAQPSSTIKTDVAASFQPISEAMFIGFEDDPFTPNSILTASEAWVQQNISLGGKAFVSIEFFLLHLLAYFNLQGQKVKVQLAKENLSAGTEQEDNLPDENKKPFFTLIIEKV